MQSPLWLSESLLNKEQIMMNIEQLNTDFAIPGHLSIEIGEGGLPFIKVSNEYATASISVYAGQVLAYQPVTQEQDVLFTNTHAVFQQGKPIRSGVPICWPWFGDDPEGKGRSGHGFARDRLWSVLSTRTTDNGETQVILGLEHSQETLQLWAHEFQLRLQITIGASLHLALETKNTGSTAFSITQALHTYFLIGDIHQVKVLGLEGHTYLDKTDNGNLKAQIGEVLIKEEVDRVYKGIGNTLTLVDTKLNRNIRITSEGSKTAVVWNPWVEKAKTIADLGDADYQSMLCVETANAADEVITLEPEASHCLVAEFLIA
jgi:glucose-6-phosphate 1-epimerase